MAGHSRGRHVVFVLAGLGAGGAERVVSLLAVGLVEAGDTVTVVAFDHPGDPIYHRLDPRVRVVRLAAAASERRGGFGAIIVRIVRLRSALFRLQPDVVISFLTKINVLTLLATIGRRAPVIVSERNNPRLQAMSGVWTKLLDRLYPRAAAIVLQTEASRVCLPSGVAAQAYVIPNPVEIQSCRRPPGRLLVVAGVGRLDPQKGFDRLLHAVAMIAVDDRNWRLKIWGEGQQRGVLVALTERLGIAALVEFAGLSESAQSWTGEADIFVLPSRHEGFPNALAEAMAAGLAVIAFDCAFGPRELIQSEVNGLLVPEGDVAGVATAIQRLVGDSHLRQRLGSRAQGITDRLAPARIIAEWQRVINLSANGVARTQQNVNFYPKEV